MYEWQFRGFYSSSWSAAHPGFCYAGFEKTLQNFTPAITLGYWQPEDYSVLENNRSTIERCSSPYFTIVSSSAQQKTPALFVELCPDIQEKDTSRMS